MLAGEFTDLGALGIAGVEHSSVAWGDYDSDGDLDVLLTGSEGGVNPISKVYRNNGNNTFSDLSAGLTGVYFGAVAWGDVDNDSDLDILLTGFDGADRISRIYRNNGNSTFTDIHAALTGVYFSAVAWGDTDNDGDLDVLLTGHDGTNTPVAKVYRNNGNSTFTDLNIELPGVQVGAVAWGDADNDGDLDILLTGSSLGGRVARIYRNEGNGSFTDMNAGLTGVSRGAVAWGDADNDGDLDVLLSGDNGSAAITKIYRNNGNSSFTDVGAALTGVSYSSVAWGDTDNDGDLDILLSGNAVPNTPTTKVYRNDGGYAFTELTANLTGAKNSAAVWGDVDLDGDLDVLLTGQNALGARIAKVYRNNAASANTVPTAPTALTATAAPSGTSLTLSWTAATDNQTAAPGLSYNLRVGTTPGGSDVFSTMASIANGKRRIPDAGPIQGTNYSLTGLTPGETYYWSVQAIDPSRSGGAFAAEKSTSTVANTAPTIGGAVANQPVNDNATLAPFTAMTITDPDNQNMLAKVTILNGVVRGDFTSATTTGWTRAVVGNNIIYSRYYHPAPNIGATVQAAIRAFVFKPRANAIKPNTTERTDFTVFINDGLANTTDSNTRVVVTSVNDAPTFGNANTIVTVNDNATVNPFSTLTVSDPDTQEMLARITILNGAFRGDFTNAVSNGWTRSTLGNNISYVRHFSPGSNIGATVQAAYRALIFQPRNNAIQPGTTELTNFLVSTSDGVANPASSQGTYVVTTSINNSPAISGTVANQTMNDNATKAVFSGVTVSDPDAQDMLVRITIDNGVNRGDFTATSTAGWFRSVAGSDLHYARYFSRTTNIGAVVQAAVRALVFKPRNNVPIGTQETTSFQVFVNDGIQNVTNSTTSVITTGVALRQDTAIPFAPVFLDSDVATVVLPGIVKPRSATLGRLWKKGWSQGTSQES